MKRLVLCTTLCLALATLAAGTEPSPGFWRFMDYGSVIAETIRIGPENTAYKGLAIRLPHDAAVVFDSGLLRYAAGTVGGFVDISRTDYTSYKGDDIAGVEGRTEFTTRPVVGWSLTPAFNSFPDNPYATAPAAHFNGLYRYGDRVVLSYSFGGVEILDSPSAIRAGEGVTFVRSLRIAAHAQPLYVLVCGRESANHGVRVKGDAVLGGDAHNVWVMVPSSPAQQNIDILIGNADPPARLDLSELIHGGPTRFPDEVAGAGARGSGDGPWAQDDFFLPLDNPWNAWVRPTAFDFFSDGRRIAIATWNGDVWIGKGVMDADMRITWRRFASGLFQPLGLVIKDDEVYVIERSQLTRLVDLNGDGEADFYASVYNRFATYPRSYAMELQTDARGDFYFIRNGNRVKEPVHGDHGCIVRIPSDGSTHEVFATGIRSANGLAIGPGGRISAADQQGNWVPTTRIDFIERGGFYGFRPFGGAGRKVGEYERPICWVPHGVDNSAGSQAFITDNRWGPLEGRLVHTSFGKSRVFLLMYEDVGGVVQGGVVQLPMRFTSGTMRARFNPRDGQLYILGMKGWQTEAVRDGCLNRLRYTGKPLNLPLDIRTTRQGVQLTFSDPLDEELATDPESYRVERWNYRYTGNYGSKEYSVEDPSREGHDTVDVLGVQLAENQRTVFLKLADMRPVMQMMIRYDMDTADGTPLRNAVYHTVHAVSN